MPGMLTLDGERIVRGHPSPGVFNLRAVLPDGSMGALRSPILPDLDDVATLGCLEALVRERWGERTHITSMFSSFIVWAVVDGQWLEIAEANTRAAALVSALEAT
jgi:hypothetical protein